MKEWFLKHKWKTLSVLTVILLLYGFRFKILFLFGSFLMADQTPQKVEAAYVLGGNSIDRAEHTAQLFKEKYFEKIVCLGGNQDGVLEYYGINQLESEATAQVLIGNNVPRKNIKLIKKSTSTKEEFEYIKTNIKQNNYKHIMVVSDKFHTRRIDLFFRDEIEDLGCDLTIVGAPSSKYNEEEWWASEEGFLFVYNEYLKIFYYALF